MRMKRRRRKMARTIGVMVILGAATEERSSTREDVCEKLSVQNPCV